MLILEQKDTVDNQNSEGNVNGINLASRTSIAPVFFLLSKYLTNAILFHSVLFLLFLKPLLYSLQ